MRKCSRCKQYKPESEFYYENRATKKLDKRCKPCAKQAYNESRQRHLAVYRRRERERYHRRLQSGVKRVLTPAQKAAAAERVRSYFKKYPERAQAKTAVRDASRRFERWLKGTLRIHKNRGPLLIRPIYCPFCGSLLLTAKAHAHHYEGYSPKHRLTVIQCCVTCHRRIHVLERDATERRKAPLSGLRAFIRRKRNEAQRRYVAETESTLSESLSTATTHNALVIAPTGEGVPCQKGIM